MGTYNYGDSPRPLRPYNTGILPISDIRQRLLLRDPLNLRLSI